LEKKRAAVIASFGLFVVTRSALNLCLMTITCFLIEDDQDDQEIFVIALQKINAEIDCKVADNGVEGLKVLEDHSFLPDFIFIDINMPKMNGIECLAAIRKLDHLRSTKVIMYSTSADANITAQCKAAGADEVLIKPPLIRQLIALLQAVLNIKQTNE
jgi:CheY-like chemotaxis protein